MNKVITLYDSIEYIDFDTRLFVSWFSKLNGYDVRDITPLLF